MSVSRTSLLRSVLGWPLLRRCRSLTGRLVLDLRSCRQRRESRSASTTPTTDASRRIDVEFLYAMGSTRGHALRPLGRTAALQTPRRSINARNAFLLIILHLHAQRHQVLLHNNRLGLPARAESPVAAREAESPRARARKAAGGTTAEMATLFMQRMMVALM